MTIIGMGPGSLDLLTLRAKNRIDEADVLIGSRRLVELFPKKPSHVAVAASDIIELLQKHPSAVVLMSGDTGFFSGAKKLVQAFPKAEVIPGVSSLSYFCARLGEAYDDALWHSLHGRSADVTTRLLQSKRLFLLTDGLNNPYQIVQSLPQRVREQTSVVIGENLSLDDERITRVHASEVRDIDYASLSVVLLTYHGETPPLLLRDDELVRTKVPMTKEEVRAIALLKLNPRAGDVMIDIGCGTGSISFALARLGVSVHALEKNPLAVETFRHNHELLGGEVTLYPGEALETLPKVPLSQAAFIGGSGGDLEHILIKLKENNPDMHVVISAVTLETLGQIMSLSAQGLIDLIDVTQVQVSQAKKFGSYHLMQAKNPIHLVEVKLV